MAKKKLREDYRDGELYHGEDVNAITKRVNELDDTSVDITNVLEGKQDKLTAGANITIDENNVISARPQDLSQYALSADVATELAKKADVSALTEYQEATNAAISANTRDIEILDNGKQDKLTAGENITIENNVISAQQPDMSPYALSADVTTELSKKQDTLTAGSGISIVNNVISAQQPDLSEYAKQCDVILVGSDMDGDKIDWSPTTGMTTPGVYRALLYVANQLITDEMIVQYFGSVEEFLTYCSQNGIKVIRDEAQSGYLVVEAEVAMRMTVTNYVVGSLVQSFTYDYSFAKHMYERVFDQSSNSWSTQYYRFLSGNDSDDISSAFKRDVTFSRRKIEELLASKQNNLTAGTNITIQNGVISAQQPDLSPYALTSEVESAISQVEESKQDKLSAGTNITIQDNVISATVPDVSGKMNKVDYEVAYTLPSGAIDLSPLNNVLTPGIYNLKVNSFIPNTSYNGVLMVGRQGNSFSQEVVISGSQTQVLKRATSNSGSTWTTMYAGCLAHVNDNSDGNGYGGINETYSANKILTLIDEKQNQLTAGTNITIVDDVISAQQPDLSPYALSADVATELSKKVDTSAYTQDKAAMQASISANTTAITQLQQSKQNNLSAGTGIQIQNDVISLTGSGGAMIDDTTTGSTTAWSSQKIVNEMGIGLIDLTNSGNAIRF